MLEAMRRGASGWIAKIFLVIIILSFAVWGIADIFTGFGTRTVAEVGSSEITPAEFQREFQNQTQRISRQIGRPLSLNEARALGIDRQVLGTMLSEATLDADADAKGLNVSQDRIAAEIVEDPIFTSALGSFSRSALDGFLRANGLSEAGYVAERRALARRQQLAEAVAGGTVVPKTVREALHTYQNETRTARFLTLPASSLGDIGEPSEAELAAYFEANKADFRAPEYRTFSYIQLDPDTLAERIEIAEEDLKAEYAARKDAYTSAERRTVRQISFDSMEEATAAKARIDGGLTFDALAAEKNLTAEDTDLGSLTRTEMLDPAVAAAAFALEEGAVSEPVSGRFRPVLVTVSEIVPAGTREFEEVRDEIRANLSEDQAVGEALDLYEAVEDDRAAGLTLKEIADKHDLAHAVIEAIDRTGRDEDGDVVSGLPVSSQLIGAVFDADVGVEADALQVGAHGSVWYDVSAIDEARDRTLTEAREAVAAAWRADQVQSRLAERAQAIIDRIESGATLDEIAAEENLAITRTAPLKRTDATPELGRAGIERLFAASIDEVFDIESASGDDRLVVLAARSTVPPYDPQSEDARTVADQLSTGLIDDILTQYVTIKRDDYGATINQTALNLALGVSEEQ